MSNKQKKVLFWVIVGLGLILVGFSIYRIISLEKKETARVEEGREEDKEEFEVLEEDDREEIDISDWMTYRNEEYGFEMKYPEEYKNDISYAIWTAQNKNLNLLHSWGINKGQEIIFEISVYPIKKQKKVFEYFDYETTNATYKLNGIIANKLKNEQGLIIVTNKYFYIVTSTFISNSYLATSEYKEYKNILNTIKIDSIL